MPIYDPAAMTVALYPARRLNLHDVYQLAVNAMSRTGLTGASGLPLAGAGNVAGTNYVARITSKTLAGPSCAAFTTPLQRLVERPASVSPEAFDHLALAGNLAAGGPLGKHRRKETGHRIS